MINIFLSKSEQLEENIKQKSDLKGLTNKQLHCIELVHEIGDKAYLNKTLQLDLFNTANITLEVPIRKNQVNYKPQFYPFKKVRKHIETVFSLLDDQFMMIRN